MTTSTVTPEIAAFAQGVRVALADLPADEVDELTDGLEADLAEAYAEDLQRELPDPVAYAAELRQAAGLPVRTKVAKAGVFAGIGESLHDTRRDIGIAIRRNPTLSAIAEFLVVLRPAWWVLRAWLATWLIASFFGSESGYWFGGGWWLVLAAFIVVSVQWGRGQWRGRGTGPLIAVGNVIAIIALLPVMATADDGASNNYSVGYEDAMQQTMQEQEGSAEMVMMDGKQVTNIYAYDANGKPLTNVQLFDQSGHPIKLFGDVTNDGVPCVPDSEDCSTLVQLGKLETGQTAQNIFPLGTIAAQWDDSQGQSVPVPGAEVMHGPAPFVKVPAVMPAPKVQPTP
jgi:hypothetical protein